MHNRPVDKSKISSFPRKIILAARKLRHDSRKAIKELQMKGLSRKKIFAGFK